jgi:hypothetical protein
MNNASDDNGFKEAKAAEYRYWQGRPAHERLAEASRLSLEAYGAGGEPVPESQRPLFRLRRPNSKSD